MTHDMGFDLKSKFNIVDSTLEKRILISLLIYMREKCKKIKFNAEVVNFLGGSSSAKNIISHINDPNWDVNLGKYEDLLDNIRNHNCLKKGRYFGRAEVEDPQDHQASSSFTNVKNVWTIALDFLVESYTS